MRRALIFACLLTALGASFAGPAVGGSAAPATSERLGELDQQVLAAVNRTRAGHGLRALVVSRDLQRAAGSHSRQMLERGFFAHDSPGGAPFAKRVRSFYQSTGYGTWSVGENLLYSTGGVTADLAVEAWLASPSHRENMLSAEWREIGIGSLRARVAGGTFGGKPTWVITMDFGTRSGKQATASSAAGTRSPSSSSARALASTVTPASSGGLAARPGKPNVPAKNGKKPSVTRVLPGGRTTQSI